MQTFINLPDLCPQREQSGRRSRSGEVALAPPHGFKGCLWFGTEVLTCTIEMILVSTVLTYTSQLIALVLPGLLKYLWVLIGMLYMSATFPANVSLPNTNTLNNTHN